jgi:phage regulator Rha-like protein
MGDLVIDGRASGSTATMSSREIAKLTGKQHQHVKRDIEVMLKELGKDVSSFGRIYLDSMKRQQTEYHLDRELTDTLVTGYSILLRHKVIQRWHALEAKQASIDEAKIARQRARLEAPALADAVKHSRQAVGKDTKHYHYSNEFDLINRVVVGSSSKQLRDIRGCSDSEPLRDLLTPGEIKAVEHMQRLNAALIDVGMPYQERKAKLEQVFKDRYQQALIGETMRLCA